MNRVFGRPRPCCFLMQHARELQEAFQGSLPIPYQKAEEICRCDPEQPLPRYYECLGWKRAEDHAGRANGRIRQHEASAP